MDYSWIASVLTSEGHSQLVSQDFWKQCLHSTIWTADSVLTFQRQLSAWLVANARFHALQFRDVHDRLLQLSDVAPLGLLTGVDAQPFFFAPVYTHRFAALLHVAPRARFFFVDLQAIGFALTHLGPLSDLLCNVLGRPPTPPLPPSSSDDLCLALASELKAFHFLKRAHDKLTLGRLDSAVSTLAKASTTLEKLKTSYASIWELNSCCQIQLEARLIAAAARAAQLRGDYLHGKLVHSSDTATQDDVVRALACMENALSFFFKAKQLMHSVDPTSALECIWCHSLGQCYYSLEQYNAALLYYQQALDLVHRVGQGSDVHASILFSFGVTYSALKKFELAASCFEEALQHRVQIHGPLHELVIKTKEEVLRCHGLAAERRLDGKHLPANAQRMCNSCSIVVEGFLMCTCRRAWYCSLGCQEHHWAEHKAVCDLCLQCGTQLARPLKCSRCMTATYCDAACQKLHFAKHKSDCSAPAVHPKRGPCANCLVVVNALRKCTGCYTIAYCTVGCQKRHWPFHKSKCVRKSEETF
jgi:tetratricopeptide (TPR) repeat protein